MLKLIKLIGIRVSSTYGNIRVWFINAVMNIFPGFELRAGKRSGWDQEDGEWHDPRREHESRTRQVQDPETDPVRKYQTAHRWVWMYVMCARTVANAHTTGPFNLEFCLLQGLCFLSSKINQNRQNDMAAQTQHSVQIWGAFVIILISEFRQVTGWKGTYCILFLTRGFCSIASMGSRHISWHIK